VPPDEFKRWLTEPRPDRKAVALDPDGDESDAPVWVDRELFSTTLRGPLWKPGGFATFSAQQTREIEEAVKRAYAEAGRRWPTFFVSYAKADGAAHLAINVIDEGPAATVGAIEILGNQKNSTEVMLSSLPIAVGDVFDRALQTRVERALWS